VWNHALRSLDEHGIRSAANKLLLCFLAGVLSSAALYPDDLGRAFNLAMTWHNYAVPKVLWIFGLVFFSPAIVRIVRNWLKTPAGETIEGIPTTELIDHLFTEGTFKRDDIERKFNVPRYRYTALAKKLKELDVLCSGPRNNETILNPDCTRETLADILAGKMTAGELERPLNIVRPLPYFARRTISESPMETDVKPVCSPCATVCAA
jgi:hypothetical protein